MTGTFQSDTGGTSIPLLSVLHCAGAGGKKFCLPHSRVLIHQPLGGVQGQATDILIAQGD